MLGYGYLMVAVVAMATTVHSQGCHTASGEPGRCINIKQCPDLNQLLQQITAKTAPAGAMQVLRQSVCDITNGAKVCCKHQHNLVSRGVSLLPRNCGRTVLVDRIVGGVDASLFAWPWIALLRGKSARESSWTCGGVLISSRYVLTAAHCVRNSRFSLEFVRVGEHQLSRRVDCESRVCAPDPQDILVEEIIVHEDYERVSGCPRCHDIALLRLSTPAQLNTAHVVPICLPMNLERDLGVYNQDFSHRFAWAAGWGTVDPVRRVPADVLQEAYLPLGKRFCDVSAYPDSNMVLCAGGEGADSCGGDSGGPLVMENATTNTNYLIGLVSSGPTFCGARQTQGIYTSVRYYISWILQHLRQ